MINIGQSIIGKFFKKNEILGTVSQQIWYLGIHSNLLHCLKSL